MFNDPAIAGNWPTLADRLDNAGRNALWATQERQAGQPQLLLVDPHDLALRHLDTVHQETEDIDVVDMLLWAGGNGIAPLEDLLMLLDRESRRGYGNAARHHVAHDLGISERTVRRRRDRTPQRPPPSQ